YCMKKYKLLSISLVIGLLISGFPVRAVPEASHARQEPAFAQEAVRDKLFLEEDIPEIIGYEQAAAELYTKRLREEETSLNEIVLRDTSGHDTRYLYAFPVKYKEGEEIKDKTLDLESVRQGEQTFYRSAGNDIVTTFSDSLSEGIRLQYEEVSLTLKPEGALQTMKSSAAPILPGEKQKFVSFAAEEAVGCSVSPTYMGFSEELVIQEGAEQREFAFRLYTHGLELYQNASGQLLLRNAEQETVAYVCDAVVFTADNRNNRLLAYSFEPVVPREEYVLRLALSEEYRADENTAYPLRVSSGIEINKNGAIEDITINSSAGSAGQSGSLFVGKRSSFGKSRILMKFPGLNLSSINATKIKSASIEIRDLLCESESMVVRCHPFNGGAWSESEADSITWGKVYADNYYAYNVSRNIYYGNGNAANDSQRYSFDVTAIVRGWKNGTYHQGAGVIFKADAAVETGARYINKTFASSNNSSYKPCLKLEITPYQQSVTFTAREVTMVEGNSRTLDYVTTPATGGYVSLLTPNQTAVSIDSASGEITGNMPGRFPVTAAFYHPDSQMTVIDVCYITVLPRQSVSSGIYKLRNKYSGDYLTSNSNASVTLKSALSVGSDGSQLWYIENYGSYCVIYSLGLRDSSSFGEKEMVFSTNSSGNTLLLYNETTAYKKWLISRAYADVCFISQYDVVNLALKANSSSSAPVLSEVNHNNASEWNLIRIDEQTFNNYYGGTIGQGGRLYVKIQVDSSAYKNGIYQAGDIEAWRRWRGVSPGVVIYGPTESVPSGVSPYVVTIKGSENKDSFPGNSVAFFIAFVGQDYADPWDNYNRGEIILDVRTNGGLANGDATYRKKVITHELGHAFKLAHPHEGAHLASVANGRGQYNSNKEVASVMNQGSIYDANNNATAYPSTHDIINLKNKWGY
ncbi:MAG: DNRLRE domain-containing protein, partial [Clostridia bacterium]